jgi:hypothetical protein
MILKFTLNGTDENPYHKWGLKQNPFPQIAKYEYMAACRQLNKLGGDPIPNTDYIRAVLEGWSQEFVDKVCESFVPGEIVRVSVEVPDEVL